MQVFVKKFTLQANPAKTCPP